MPMKAHLSPKTVAEYCDGMQTNQIKVNTDYQRGSVWPKTAKASLVESILLGFPIPKIFLFQETDLKTKKTTYEIVDGQQRSNAILEFFLGSLKLSKNSPEHLANLYYEDLDEESQNDFLTYQLSIDVFPNEAEESVRESFRRMNSHTTVMNSEENRHAKWQGEFKWFVLELTSTTGTPLFNLGVLTKKQLARMQDAKLIADIIYTIEHGIQTTKAGQLDKLYAEFNDDYPGEKVTRKRFRDAFDAIFSMPGIHKRELMRPYNFHMLVAALMHQKQTIPALSDEFGFKGKPPPRKEQEESLIRLGAVLEEDPPKGELEEFYIAAKEKTNVEETRRTRFQWICRALAGEI